MSDTTNDEDRCPDCGGTGWHNHAHRVRCGECQEPYTRTELDESVTTMQQHAGDTA